MKIAVTGASGQLGTVLLRRLIADRTVKRVLSIDVRPPFLASGKVTHLELDVRDRELARHLEGVDALVHLAFIVTHRRPRAEMDDVNIGGSKNVFTAAAAAGVSRIVYSSSIAAYGVVPGHPVPLTEESPRIYQPEFAYSANKYDVEAYLDRFEKEHPNIRVVRFRPSVLIGQKMQNPLTRALGHLLDRGIMPEVSKTPMPLVWDDDVAEAITLALAKDVRGAFNVSADEPATPVAIAEAANLRLVRPPEAALLFLSRSGPLLEKLGVAEAFDPAWQKHGGVAMVPSSERARKELGWSPKCPRGVDVVRKYVELSPGKLDVRIRAFFRLVSIASARMMEGDDQQLQGVTARVHLALTGKGGGDFSLLVERGKIRVASGIPRPPTSAATLPAALWLDLLAGRASLATVQFTGGLRIEGDPMGSFVIGGLLARYRRLSEAEGVPGAATRAFTRWMTQGGAT